MRSVERARPVLEALCRKVIHAGGVGQGQALKVVLNGIGAHLTNDQDRAMLPWVKRFNPYDLYSKATERPDKEKLRPFYQELIAEYFPPELSW